ncbi:MAG: hypothetical protein IJ848_02250 [Alphaproteobacteria bacterium]|nr:hypothetical protein [Alphaproteobacteria bacterium]
MFVALQFVKYKVNTIIFLILSCNIAYTKSHNENNGVITLECACNKNKNNDTKDNTHDNNSNKNNTSINNVTVLPTRGNNLLSDDNMPSIFFNQNTNNNVPRFQNIYHPNVTSGVTMLPIGNNNKYNSNIPNRLNMLQNRNNNNYSNHINRVIILSSRNNNNINRNNALSNQIKLSYNTNVNVKNNNILPRKNITWIRKLRVSNNILRNIPPAPSSMPNIKNRRMKYYNYHPK